jgi:hypothetical protein
MLDIARHRPYGDRVLWIEGDASRLGTPGADLAIMTGHVAQFLLDDGSWQATLGALRAALRPGGSLAFESRNHGAREWEGWTRSARRSVEDPTAGWVDTWCEVDDVGDQIVSYTIHYLFATTGQELVSPIRLRFRPEDELKQSLVEAGFAVKRVYGEWDRRPTGPRTPELIIVAVR